MPNYSTIPDPYSVIYLGHKAKEPLIHRSSELIDGLEPHDQFLHAVVQGPLPPVLVRVQGCTQGGAAGWVYREGYTGPSPSRGQIEAYL